MTTETTGGAPAAPAASELSPPASAPAVSGVAAEAAQPAAGEGEQPPQPGNETPEHRKPHYRFSEMSKQIREAELRAARLEGELEATRRAQAQPQPAPVQEGPPDPNDRGKYPLGDIDPQFYQDMIAYGVKTGVKSELEARENATREQVETQARVERLRSALAETSQPGFERAGEFLQSIPQQHEGFLHDICATPNPALVSMYLSDPRNAEQLRGLVVMDAASRNRALGVIAGTLGARVAMRQGGASPPAPPPPPAAGAPVPTPPITPAPQISGGGGAAPLGPPPQGDMKAYKAWRERAFS